MLVALGIEATRLPILREVSDEDARFFRSGYGDEPALARDARRAAQLLLESVKVRREAFGPRVLRTERRDALFQFRELRQKLLIAVPTEDFEPTGVGHSLAAEGCGLHFRASRKLVAGEGFEPSASGL